MSVRHIVPHRCVSHDATRIFHLIWVAPSVSSSALGRRAGLAMPGMS